MNRYKPLIIQQFLMWCGGGHSKETVKSYDFGLRPLIRYLEEINKEVQECTLTDLSSYALWLENKGLRGSTRQTYLGALRTLWNWLYRQNMVDFDEKMIPVPNRADSESHEYIPIPDFNKMMATFNDFFPVELRNKAIMAFIYYTGVRVGENCSMNASDIDLTKKRGRVETFKQRNAKNKYRTIYWNTETNDLLKRWLPIRQEFLKLYNSNTDALWISLDTNGGGERIGKCVIQRFFRDIRQRAGLSKKYTPHSARHGFGHNAVIMGMNPRFQQITMGHKKLSSTEIYMQVEQKDVEREYHRTIGNMNKVLAIA